ncbi:MAG TPA: HNH endonuclease signature motif containing protein [Rariglobus sp.]|jgi:hypothetical protein|nr:HNH endonuclease signature motif containing protein [Rariglobus sp.]
MSGKNEDPGQKSNRIRPGRSQERRVWDESGSRCQFCGAPGTTALHIHHLDENPANTVDLNLIAICAACHERYKHGVISRNDTYRVKYFLAAGTPPFPLLAIETPPKPRTGKTKIDVGVNHGQVAEKIVNNNYGENKPAPIILPGTVASDPDRYNYLEYLMKRLAKFRQAGASYGQKRKGKVHVGVIRSQVENEWGVLPKDLKLEKWEPLVRQLKVKIEKTALGRNRTSQKKGCYSSFEVFLAKGDTDE